MKSECYRFSFALGAWGVLLTFAAIALPNTSLDPKLGFVVIGITLILSAYTLLVLAFHLHDQIRALKTAENSGMRKLWLGFQILLLALAAAAVLWQAWPR